MTTIGVYDGTALRTPEIRMRLFDLYDRCFSGPPWNDPPEKRAAYRERFLGDLERPGFRCALAWSGNGLGGFATGWPTAAPFPDTRFYAPIRGAFADEVIEERLVGTFEVDELAVAPEARRRGLGRALVDELLGVPPRDAWLVTARKADAAVRFYQSLGWEELSGRLEDGGEVLLFATP